MTSAHVAAELARVAEDHPKRCAGRRGGPIQASPWVRRERKEHLGRLAAFSSLEPLLDAQSGPSWEQHRAALGLSSFASWMHGLEVKRVSSGLEALGDSMLHLQASWRRPGTARTQYRDQARSLPHHARAGAMSRALHAAGCSSVWAGIRRRGLLHILRCI